MSYTVDMSEYNLPRGYLSYSAMTLWKRSKDQYRMKYYGNQQYDIDTPYTRFGKYIAEKMEDPHERTTDPVLSQIPAYQIPEHSIEIEVEGIPVKAFLDSFDPEKGSILEYKTGVRTKEGIAPWDNVKVHKHDQLDFYTMLVEEDEGRYDPLVKLVWMETEWAEACEDQQHNDKVFNVCNPALRLTGHFEVFEREIEGWELLRMKQLLQETASEISEDYTKYQKTSET